MTNYDAIVSAGPRYLAELTTEVKIQAIKKVCEKFGIPFEVSEKLRTEMIIEQHEFLLKEIE